MSAADGSEMSYRGGRAKGPPYRFELVEGVAQVRIPARRWQAAEALAAGSAAIVGIWVTEAVGDSRPASMGVGLIGLVLAGLAGKVAARLRSETLRVRGGWLEQVLRYGPFTRNRRWRGDRIARMIVWGEHGRHGGKRAGVRFEHDGEEVLVALGLDAFEGAEVLAWLAKRLPPGAVRSE